MKVNTNITIDLVLPRGAPPVMAMQYDSGTRTVTIGLLENGAAWEIPDDALPMVVYSKPSGESGQYDTVNGASAFEIAGNTITVTFASQLLTSCGLVAAAVVFRNESGQQLSTFPFAIDVRPNPGAEGGSEDTGTDSTGGFATYVLPIANDITLGGVMPVAATAQMTQPVGVDQNGRLFTGPSQNPDQGAEGFSPIARVTQTADGATISITDQNGTTTATVKNGKRGSNILKVISDPVDYTTVTGGKLPIKRLNLTAIKAQAGVDEVLVGDQILRSYYLYNIYHLDSTYAYMDSYVSIRGATGPQGPAGSDATVTAENITKALGYVPVGAGTNSPLTGKKIVYDGDSICAAAFGYPKLIADKTACIFDNQAVGGARLCANSERHSVVNNLANLPTDGDIYCFQGGINDWWANTPVGTFTQGDYTGAVDPATIYGAMETICRYALNNFFGKAICFVITHKVQNAAYSKNTAGHTFWDYRKAMIDVCEKYSVPYYDAFTRSGLNGWNAAQKEGLFVSGDGTHPNETAYEAYYVPQLISLFERIIPRGDYVAPAKPVTYTNILKTSVGSDGQPYNGGTGFKEGYYLEQDGTETTATLTDITGFIAVKPNDVFRFKDIQVCPSPNGNTKAQIHYYDASFNHMGNSDYLYGPASLSEVWEVVTNDAGTDIVQFTFPAALSNAVYIRMCCKSITSASVITINEEIG